jgi:hypothetical protein
MFILGKIVHSFVIGLKLSAVDLTTSFSVSVPPALTNKRTSMYCLFVGMIYTAGGTDTENDVVRSTADSFNPITKEWTILPDMNIERSDLAFLLSLRPLFHCRRYGQILGDKDVIFIRLGITVPPVVKIFQHCSVPC